jgi:VWFA-related protein
MTAFFDSVVEAARLLRSTAPRPDARRVEVVLSDGEDNNSTHHRLDDALREIQRSDCIFYAINPCVSSINLNKISVRGQEAMQSLALETGGWVFMPNGLPDLEAIFTRIATELRFQYLLEYYSSNSRTDGAFRRIAVTVPGRPDFRIRARQGYYAPMS